MSLVAARLGLRHRCTIERFTTASDGGGGTTETWADHATAVPCRAWTDVRRGAEGEQGDKVTVVTDHRIIVPLDTDVTEADRVTEVTDAAGAVVFSGPLAIDAIGRHRTHLELIVAEVE